MIDISHKVITAVRDGVTAEFENCFVSGEYLRALSSLPAVSIMEYGNIVPQAAIDSGSMENYATVMYQIEVYAVDQAAKKTEARMITKKVDDILQGLGFRRVYYLVFPSQRNATLYRIVTRYQGTVLRDGSVAR